MPLDLRLIRHVLVLAQHGNFRRAARTLHVSQPTLTRNIAALERSLGVRLFDRSRSAVEPTAFGRLVLERGGELLARESDLAREIALLAGLEIGRLVVSAGPYPYELSISRAIARLIDEHPRLTVQATVKHGRDVVRDVLSGQADVGVTDRAVAASQERLLIEPLPTHQIYVACRPGHPLADKSRLTPAEIVAWPLAATDAVGHIAGLMRSLGAPSGELDPDTGDYRPAIHLNSLAMARQVACDSNALVPGTAGMLSADVAAGRLVTLDFQNADLQTRYAILTLKGRSLLPSAAKFIALLRAAEAQIVRGESQSAALLAARRRALASGRRKRR